MQSREAAYARLIDDYRHHYEYHVRMICVLRRYIWQEQGYIEDGGTTYHPVSECVWAISKHEQAIAEVRKEIKYIRKCLAIMGVSTSGRRKVGAA